MRQIEEFGLRSMKNGFRFTKIGTFMEAAGSGIGKEGRSLAFDMLSLKCL